MGGEKIKHEFEINDDMLPWLKEMTEKYGLPDKDKALRVLVDFAMSEGDQEVIFNNMRCNRC